MKFGVVIFPGSNCDRDMVEAIADGLGMPVKPLWHKDEDISGFAPEDCIVLPGGFSYGDYLRCGAIARFSPMMKSVIRFAQDGGKVLGVCNGFQVLCESGLLPGALLRNKEQKFICKNIFIKSERSGGIWKIPIAHGEGRFYADEATLAELQQNKQVLYRYCDGAGEVNEGANINGSLHNIAGICNRDGNVFDMMPHPERAVNTTLGNTDGLQVFNELLGLAQLV